MPVDFQQIQARIVQIAGRERLRREQVEERRLNAVGQLNTHAQNLEALQARAGVAAATDPSVRCAVPVSEFLTFSAQRPPSPAEATLIAVDGSQINPDRHAALQFGVVNAGAVIMRLRSGEVPEVCTSTELLYGEDLETQFGMMSDRLVALRRDAKERELLDDLSGGFRGDVVTFTDGPLELWGTGGEEAREFQAFLEKYKAGLSRLQSRGVITAGYVDKPGADLVVRLLELMTMTGDQVRDLQTLRSYHPYRGVDDRLLFSGGGQPLIFPGCRSAVFALQSSSQNIYQGSLALHFFYLNVGSIGHPWLVRVEIPQWVATNDGMLTLLHATLVEQCEIMGSKPYPYLLHRAHETAVVRLEERAQVENMLTLELNRHGQPMYEKSNKQAAKDSGGRKSF